MADDREWRGLPTRGKRLKGIEEMPVRTTWHGANAVRHTQRSRAFPWRFVSETTVTAGLAIFAGLFFAKTQMSPQLNITTSTRAARTFAFCHIGGGTNCVVDGDTFWMDGQKIRIADIDTPETHPPRCAQEAELGARATQRLQDLLNAGPVTLTSVERDTDRYGRALRIVMRNGRSLGDTLISEGLARRWDGARHPWCAA